MKFNFALSIALLPMMYSGCKIASKESVGSTVNTIYYGGDIITMEGDSVHYAEAIAVKDGKIDFVGSKAGADSLKGDSTNMVDLQGKTLLPGFVDGHSHFSEVGLMMVTANLLSPPDGPVKNIPELQQSLRDFMKTSSIVKNHNILIGLNFDESQLEEHRVPTKADLDAVSTTIPIMIVQQSGHFGVVNSKVLDMLGITAATPDPAGGVIKHEADGKTPNGVFYEVAFFQLMVKLMPKFTPEEAIDIIKSSQDIYMENGFTTIQDGKTTAVNLKLLPVLADKGLLKVDVVSYPDLAAMGDVPILHGSLMSHNYTKHFRIGGVKLTLDGSPQGKSAWFTKPYFIPPPGESKSYVGIPAFTNEKLSEWFTLAYKNNWQLLCHANGDAAIDQFLSIAKKTADAYPGNDRRTVLVHGQFMRADQVPEIKALGIFPTLFPLHTFNWGDYHRQSVAGPERAENISPTGWLLKDNIKFSVHSDAPVIFPKSMPLISTAVNRTTRSGYILGPKQRITPYQALEAMTIWPAYQYFEENTKGSLKVGKLADFVILDKNPIKVDLKTINSIKIVETIKEGKIVFPLANSADKPLSTGDRKAITWQYAPPCDVQHTGKIVGKTWILSSLNGKDITGDELPTIKLDKEKIIITDGTNSLSADYKTGGNNVTFSNTAITKAKGGANVIALEKELLTALHSVDSYQADQDDLMLFSKQTVVAKFSVQSLNK